ncbi:HIT family protein [Arcanobacterium urinimassiliense]|uniref:HIT family protein n=1 Tax=Arcanobacterium urinimassiliense TaxID=1871014 RepID=UPI00093F7EA2|nr:HIT family protein [Arcanobacterium urinimassiliense]MBS6274933.1 HIT family protein [Actinomycetaceae bacterium]
MSIYSEIFAGRAPGRFVWEDEVCVVLATIEPVTPGHVLVVPRLEVDKYFDLPPQIFAHLVKTAQIIGRAQETAFHTTGSILTIMGFSVPHVHLHLIPANPADVHNFRKAAPQAHKNLEAPMQKLRQVLIDMGYGEFVPDLCQLKNKL